jgi:four helix bundle suffix protein
MLKAAQEIKWFKQLDPVYKILQREVKGQELPKKTELKLTGVARASLEELKLDYEDFLRQRQLTIWSYANPRRQDLIRRRFTEADQVAYSVRDLHKQQQGTIPEIAANGSLTLIIAACSLLDRQLESLAEAFKKDGGFQSVFIISESQIDINATYYLILIATYYLLSLVHTVHCIRPFCPFRPYCPFRLLKF